MFRLLGDGKIESKTMGHPCTWSCMYVHLSDVPLMWNIHTSSMPDIEAPSAKH